MASSFAMALVEQSKVGLNELLGRCLTMVQLGQMTFAWRAVSNH